MKRCSRGDNHCDYLRLIRRVEVLPIAIELHLEHHCEVEESAEFLCIDGHSRVHTNSHKHWLHHQDDQEDRDGAKEADDAASVQYTFTLVKVLLAVGNRD